MSCDFLKRINETIYSSYNQNINEIALKNVKQSAEYLKKTTFPRFKNIFPCQLFFPPKFFLFFLIKIISILSHCYLTLFKSNENEKMSSIQNSFIRLS